MPAPRRLRPVPEGYDWASTPNRILTKSEVEAITTLGFETFRRHYPNLVVSLSPRRVGARAGDVYALMRRPVTQQQSD
jgi:hypothetical protein